ncbi:unnamed protein product [Porites evermanni]|uniref:Apple domain-containing protein n=1 Tax=Porites evermanni TaxID=104178 RepID=A0ABN8N2D4_9CNID|nr:unnamed protein product [Porites evermanni]
MKELQRTFFYLSVVLETVSEMLCLGNEFVMIHRQDRMRSAVFHKVKEDEVLEGHLISVHKVSSDLDCLQKCLSQAKCVSFNFQLQSPDLHHTCELNNVTREYFGTLGPRRGFSYWEAIRDILQASSHFEG